MHLISIMKNALAFAALSILPLSVSALPTPATDDDTQADYRISSVIPENCSQVTELSSIEIYYDIPDGGWSASISGIYAPDLWDQTVPYRKLEVTRKGVTVSTLSVETCYQVYGPTRIYLKFNLDTPQTNDGIYEIVIPDKYIVDMANYSSGKQTLKYQIGDVDPGDEEWKPEPITGKFHLESRTPAESEMVEELSTITAQWLDSNDQPCVWNGPETLFLTGYTRERQNFNVAQATVNNIDGKIEFTLTRPFDCFGTFYLTIPAGTIQSADGSESNPEEIVLDFPILYEKGSSIVSTYPEEYTHVDGTHGGSISTIALSFANSVSVGTLGIKPYLLSETGEIVEADDVRVFNSTQATLFFNDADLLKKGKYTVVVPRNTFYGVAGSCFYYNFTPMSGQEIPDVPPGTKLEITECTIGGYDMLDADNGIPYLGVDVPISIRTNLDYASDVCWYWIIDVTDCKSEADYINAPSLHTTYLDKSGDHFTGTVLSPGGLIRNLTSDRLYCVRVHSYLNYYNPAMRQDWGDAYSAVFCGGSAPYEYADCDVRIQPMPGMELTKGTPIVMTFSTPVNFVAGDSGIPQGQEGTIRLTATPNDDNTVWSFLVPEGAFADSNLEIHFGFTDTRTGKRVRPSAYNVPETETNTATVFNFGTEDFSQIVVVYGSFGSKPEFSVSPAPGSTVDILDNFSYTFSDGDEIMPSWMGEAVVRDSVGNIVARLVADDLEENGGHVKVDYASSSADAKSIRVYLSLDNPVTTPGTYTVEYPFGYFSKGREQNSDITRPAVHEYIIAAEEFEIDFEIPEMGESSQKGDYVDGKLMIGVPDTDHDGVIKVKVEEGVEVYYAIRNIKNVNRVASLASDMTLAENNEVHIPYGEGTLAIQTVKDGVASAERHYEYSVYLDETLGIATIGTENGEAIYFNLQGVKVENPESGIFVKVSNSKAEKIIR